ncbi:981_t:CDS:2, partial [Gigaspora margarita]
IYIALEEQQILPPVAILEQYEHKTTVEMGQRLKETLLRISLKVGDETKVGDEAKVGDETKVGDEAKVGDEVAVEANVNVRFEVGVEVGVGVDENVEATTLQRERARSI